MSEVRPGYKQTEVGVIPEDWEPLTIGDVIHFQGGLQPEKDCFVYSPRSGYIRLIQIRDYKTNKYETYIPVQLAKRLCKSDDIMIGRYGPPIFQILKGIEGAYNVALIKAIPADNLNKNYAYYYLFQEKLFAFIEKLSQRSSGQTGVDLKELRNYPFPLPTLSEQTAIADVLSDTDALIQSLDQLIAKKRNIKQGAMQELLTGKKRLPGFGGSEKGIQVGYKQTEAGLIPEDWEVKMLDGQVDLLTGFPFSSRGYREKGIRLLRGSNVKRGQLDWSSAITEYWPEITQRISQYELQPGDLVIAMDGALVGRSFAKIKSSDLPALVLQRVARLRSKRIDISYVYHHIVNEKFAAYCDSVKTVTAIPHISPQDIRSFIIAFPSDTAEQTAIAAVLSDMDAEIAALEQKRDKYKDIKQGMMQELLTGKTRLV